MDHPSRCSLQDVEVGQEVGEGPGVFVEEGAIGGNENPVTKPRSLSVAECQFPPRLNLDEELERSSDLTDRLADQVGWRHSEAHGEPSIFERPFQVNSEAAAIIGASTQSASMGFASGVSRSAAS